MNGAIIIVSFTLMNYYQTLPHIKALVLDIDGVLTNNQILVTDEGQFLRSMNVRDGYAIKKAIQAGILIAIISGGRSEGTKKRLEILGINEIHLGIEDKYTTLLAILHKWNISASEIAYMGDDIMDIPCMIKVGIAACPKDAVSEVVTISSYISNFNGGEGCVRELIEQILKAQSKWP